VHLFPKLITTAGFERGTGVMINIIPPEFAAEQLRKVSVEA
jgi:UDPglucose--hexose-1-phosphate uridylyltransferase